MAAWLDIFASMIILDIVFIAESVLSHSITDLIHNPHIGVQNLFMLFAEACQAVYRPSRGEDSEQACRTEVCICFNACEGVGCFE